MRRAPLIAWLPSAVTGDLMTGEEGLDILWVLFCAVLVMLMQAGFLCLETGFTRSKNSINVAIKNLSDFGISTLIFAAFGFSLLFGPSQFGWIGNFHSIETSDPNTANLAFFLFQVMFCATATTIVSGAVAERMRFGGYLITAAVISGLIYPVFGHWAWNGIDTGVSQGWLGRLGFVDFAGSTVVHSMAGWSALALVSILGAREDRFDTDGTLRSLQGHNLPFAMLGALFLWVGWLGFNGGSTQALDSRVPGIIINTLLSGSAGLAVALLLGWLRTGRSDVELVINGSLAGFVSITASCNAVSPLAAIAIGGIGAVVMAIATEILVRAKLDDVVGAIPVHAAAGVWGTLAVALFGDLETLDTGLDRLAQFAVQLLGALVCFIWSFGLIYAIFRGINRVFPIRVSAEAERMGLNVAEHGATTELYDLMVGMERQASTGDLSLRVAVEPFTEVGQIATHYNEVMHSLQNAVTKADRIKNEFISTVSHELRTPLTSIHASLDLVAEGAVGPIPQESLELVEIARTNSDRLIRLINELLDVQQIESGSTTYNIRTLEIRTFVEQVIAENRDYADRLAVAISLRNDAVRGRVEADPDRLIQVLTNLLSNAAKFSPPGSSIQVSIDRRDRWIRVTVSDPGPGIPDAFRGRVFEKFAQADASDSRRKSGTGLGLSISKAIIERLGGRIDFETTLGKGSRFFFELPELRTPRDAAVSTRRNDPPKGDSP
jgi:Amt family ammonium transporter